MIRAIEEWETTTCLEDMLNVLPGRVSSRKLHLLLIAWHGPLRIRDDLHRQAIVNAEYHAERGATIIDDFTRSYYPRLPGGRYYTSLWPLLWDRLWHSHERDKDDCPERAQDRCHAVRCIVPNPLIRQPDVTSSLCGKDGEWLKDMAKKVYGSLDFAGTSELVPACVDKFGFGVNLSSMSNLSLPLQHLRTGKHVHGCWAIDMLLGKQ